VKRRDLERRIREIARAKGLTVEAREGAGHTVVRVGDAQTTIPRHSEINELTARGILRTIERAH
jgi:mRNA interferase HicA